MKTFPFPLLLGALAGSLLLASNPAMSQSAPPPAPDPRPAVHDGPPPGNPAEVDEVDEASPPPDASPEPDSQALPPVESPPAEPAITPPASRPTPAVRQDEPVRRPAPNAGPQPPDTALADGEKGLRLNFRGVPLDLVLNYLSDAAGFVINLETNVSGEVDVWSNQPLTRDEAFDLLNSVLRKNGYAAIRNGRTLTIVSRDEAKKRDIPVVSGYDPESIPRSDEIVTQIIPVRFINAVQLVKDLQPLLPESASLTANEGGNALVLTDTQSNIRRMAEIVQALDQAIASVSSVRVFPLRYADAKALAATITQLFQTQESSRGNNNQGGPGRFFAEFRRGENNAGGQGPTGSTSARAPTPRVVAVADERSNSVVVSAPAEQMTVIAGVVEEVDTDVEDITEIRVFRLRHADPQETADLLTSLFEDSTTQQNNRNRGGGFRFGGQGGPFGARNNATDQSARTLQENRVVAVPDHRTRSVVVTASRALMGQIAGMLDQLDEDPARKQKVFVYSVENTDPQAIQQVLQSLFPEPTTGASRNMRNTSRTQNESSLNTRQTQTRNQGTRNTGTTFGGGGVGGGNTTLGGNR